MRRLVPKLAVVSWALLVLVMAALTAILSSGIDSPDGIQIAALCSAVVGARLTIKVPSNWVGPLALVAGSAWVVYRFGNVYATTALTSEPPGAHLMGWAGSWAGAFFPLGVTTLIVCFPTGKPVGRWWVVMVGPLAGAVSTLIGAILIWGLPLATLVDQDGLSQASGYAFVDTGFVLGFFFALPATVSVLARYRRSGTVERMQIKWLLAATSIFAVGFLVTVAIDDTNDNLW